MEVRWDGVGERPRCHRTPFLFRLPYSLGTIVHHSDGGADFSWREEAAGFFASRPRSLIPGVGEGLLPTWPWSLLCLPGSWAEAPRPGRSSLGGPVARGWGAGPVSHPDLEAVTSGLPGVKGCGDPPWHLLYWQVPFSHSMEGSSDGALIQNIFFKGRKVLGNATREQLPSHHLAGDREQPDQ